MYVIFVRVILVYYNNVLNTCSRQKRPFNTKKTMILIRFKQKITPLVAWIAVILALGASSGCEKREVADLEKPEFPSSGNVFLDDFTGDLGYGAFGGSDILAFQVDKEVTYNGTTQSMRFEVPDDQSPRGSYAGGVFISNVGRNLTGYNCLSFYIKATQPAVIGSVGFGNDFGALKYQVTMSNLAVNSNWKQVIIPIPDPSKLTAEKGLFYYASGPDAETGKGFTFWIDEVKFEKRGNLGVPVSKFFNGRDSVVSDAFYGDKVELNRFITEVNLPSGVNQTVGIAPGYFTFSSSNPGVASVNENGIVTINDSVGTATITAKVGGKDAGGSLTINFEGSDLRPNVRAPLPNQSPGNVVSIFSDAYQEPTSVVLNPYWTGSTTKSSEIKVQGDNIVRYYDMNYVAMVAGSNVNVLDADVFHLDFWTPEDVAGKSFKIELVDFGANGAFGGGDDRVAILQYSQLTSKQWVSIDVPLTSFTGPRPQANLAQIVFSSTPNNSLTNIYVDNVYFYKKPGLPIVPTSAAPVPTFPAADVISIFSDSYSNLAGTNLNPAWGQATIVSQPQIAGNTTLLYSGLNFQGTQLASNQDVSAMNFLHLDYYSGNSTSLKVFLISPGPVETPVTLNVPTSSGWNSIDIPMSSFAPVNLSSVFQLKFEGNGTIYLDNILFRK